MSAPHPTRRLSQRLQPIVTLLLAAIVLAGVPSQRAETQDMVADLSKHLVAITTGFTGTEVLLFGAVEEPRGGGPRGEVAVVVRGPATPVTMRRKSRVAGIWMNTASMTFDRVPSFYAVAASGPLAEIASPQVRQRNGIGLDALDLPLPPAKASPNVAEEWRDAMIRAKQRKGLFSADVRRVVFLGARLFRTEVYFPANVPTGSYQVETYLLRDGQVVSAQTTPLIVSKVGMEATLTRFAYNYGAVYGLVAILVALLAGWGGYALFRKA
ncbi:TIGR02186 family protein [Rhodovibrio salinarum]|uniref:Transmembrane protein (Alph_Pro_TM) n=1 Tax=Rhodovibrio salinarum TaxID=1087 RepID=A0A934QHT8_9PROT|nr:TIGR02186 family protein [Rhodovibrio salinarum]MBK1697059.1 hypothetical protein [Rhodovibrio salinarum]